ncbi:MAG: ATP-binding cassette domain-containing protein, partial [Planctomycetes bacterium]|nr:ATP-binding cassette domain-containing protein [Planctomycetota bacterium]
MDLVELGGVDTARHARRQPEELSGGQQQRVGVARPLATDPAYLLMGEPFGAVDALTRDTLQQELLSLREKLTKTIVFVTHDIFEALTLGDRIAILHEGELQQVGTKDDVLGNPATPFVRELFEKPAKQLAAFREVL